jgi:hypothetical protein
VQAPVAELQFGSAWQLAEHPSNGVVLPSSQLSAPSLMPSPQVVCEHTLGEPEHLYPISYFHVGEQPSPAAVLPSSHSSEDATIPSPQIAIFWQGFPGGTQEYPGSTVRQLAEHPSPLTLLPSSHASSGASMPSPQPGGAGAVESPPSTLIWRPSPVPVFMPLPAPAPAELPLTVLRDKLPLPLPALHAAMINDPKIK